MKIRLDTVRKTLRWGLGAECFSATFIKTVTEDPTQPTAYITPDGLLGYNPDFTEQYIGCPEDLFSLLLHELLHVALARVVDVHERSCGSLGRDAGAIQLDAMTVEVERFVHLAEGLLAVRVPAWLEAAGLGGDDGCDGDSS